MDEKNTKLARFFTACDELITGKFILADTKIGELLRAVATSDDLTGLFGAVTDGFDYPAAKAAYLKRDNLRSVRGEAYLPSDRRELLAFVFCLLVEFDNGTMKLNDFLLRYFYEDGSYTASYALFVNRVIRPFRDIVRDCFPEAGREGELLLQQKHEDELMDSIGERISVERARLLQLSLDRESAAAGELILAELYAAAGRRDVSELKALLCGYLYYLHAVDASSENSEALFTLAGEL